jgi:predicted transcriptional regulator
LTPEKIDEAVALYNGGLSVQAVAERFGITRSAMWPHLHKRANMRPRERYGSENPFYRGGITEDDHAQNLVEQAIEDGILKRPDCCEQCGSSGKFRDGRTAIQAHHCDYNQPLDVMWLCQKCHHEWHKRHVAIRKAS